MNSHRSQALRSIYRSHALRGNASCIAPAMRDEERHCPQLREKVKAWSAIASAIVF